MTSAECHAPMKAYVQCDFFGENSTEASIETAKAIFVQADPSAGNRAESKALARKNLHRACPAPLKGTPSRQRRFSFTRA